MSVFLSVCVCLAVTGKDLLDVIENGVSQYPRLEGRFPQLSGLKFAFDPEQPSGQRVIRSSLRIKKRQDRHESFCLSQSQALDLSLKLGQAEGKGGCGGVGESCHDGYEPLRLDETYLLVTKEYLKVSETVDLILGVVSYHDEDGASLELNQLDLHFISLSLSLSFPPALVGRKGRLHGLGGEEGGSRQRSGGVCALDGQSVSECPSDVIVSSKGIKHDGLIE